ncbi:bile acid:sodium symporter family protein [Paraglaciecola arctica]|uniref:bile acid:sodium symporter family protein n=1 Tax=Paraglaciecola arctica TaxID=1128911 RepID=UPI001C06FB2B|nr:bile acid:sodium symporter family protein [Paraglaciecola arctica]MBU3003986.1 bile acid:sodium symporter family protein [Paraglaciecola arctica]
MTDSFLTQVIMPLVLALIMFGMGLSLTKQDFLELGKEPKPVAVGLFGQLLLLPLLAYGIAITFNLSEHLAVGIMILAACPGGTSSNILSQLARANLALSVSLTAVTTLICVITTPLIIRFAIEQFSQTETESFSLLSTTLGLIFITLIPVLIGILIRHKFSAFANRSEAFFRHLSTAFLVLMIVAITYQERENLVDSFVLVSEAALSLNLLAIVTGLLLGLLFRLVKRDCVTLGIEVGVQNSSMAILIAITFLDRPDYAIAAGVYGLVMYLGAGLLIFGAKRIPVSN